MHRLRLEQQVVERLLEQGTDFGEGPVVTGGDGSGCTHGEDSFDACMAPFVGEPRHAGGQAQGHHKWLYDAVNPTQGTGLHLINI
ncbi:hypothetical protein ELF01_25780 [Salmonella enterica subsp. enterica serovar Typhimurium]|nr:hypothetical protein [Salmonella enterica subsp. enterica serovar Typhimurium]